VGKELELDEEPFCVSINFSTFSFILLCSVTINKLKKINILDLRLPALPLANPCCQTEK